MKQSIVTPVPEAAGPAHAKGTSQVVGWVGVDCGVEGREGREGWGVYMCVDVS